MRKINLKAKNLPNSANDKSYGSQTSIILGIILLLVAAGLYGSVWYLKDAQNKKILVVKNNIKVLTNDLDRNKSYKEVYDFQDRLLELKRILKDKVVQTNVLEQIAETTMRENVLTNLKVNTKDGLSEVELVIKTANLENLSKQLNSYNKIDINNRAVLGGSSLKGDLVEANISFTIPNLNVKKQISN